MFDTNPFVPFCSDRARVSDPAERYQEEWGAANVSLDSLLELHREEDEGLRHDREGFSVWRSDHKVRRVRNRHVLKLRRAYANLHGKAQSFDMDPTARLLTTAHILSVHARKGEGTFQSPLLRYVGDKRGYTTDEIVSALGVDSYVLRQKRQVMVAQVFSWVDQALGLLHTHRDASDDYRFEGFDFSYGSTDNQQLLGLTALSPFSDLTKGVVLSFLKGFVMFGYADDYATRKEAAEAFPVCVDGKTPFKVGGGMNLPFWTAKLEETKQRPGDLWINHDTLGSYVGLGYLVSDPRPYELEDVKSHYVRFDTEEGLSDVAALIYLKLQYGDMRMLGGMVSDGLDTHKGFLYDPFFGSLAGYAAKYVAGNYRTLMGEDLVPQDENLALIYLGAKLNTAQVLTSQSHRKLNEGRPSFVQALLTEDHDGASLRLYGPLGKDFAWEPGCQKLDIPFDRVVARVEQRMEDFEKVA